MTKEYGAKVGMASNMVGGYFVWTCGMLFLYVVTPAISYIIFWNLIPAISLTMIFCILLFPTVFFRLLLLLTNQLNLPSKEYALTLLLLLWISILQLIWYPLISSELPLKQIFSTFAFTIVATLVTFLGGEALAYLLVQRTRLVRTCVLVAYGSLGLVVMDAVIRGFKYYGYFLFSFQNPASGEIYNYLALGDSLAIIGILLLSTQRKVSPWRYISLYFATTLLLFFAYSRTSLLVFFVIGLSILYVRFRIQLRHRSSKFLMNTMLIGVILAMLVAFLSLNKDILDSLHPTLMRVSNLFTGEDLSLQKRIELLQNGFRLLSKHWLLGHFMIEAFETGWGTYVHNWLSFWLAYGIGPFLLSIGLIFSLLLKSWRIRNRGSAGAAAFGILGYCVLAIAFARSYIWPFIWFALGFTGTLPALMGKQRAMP